MANREYKKEKKLKENFPNKETKFIDIFLSLFNDALLAKQTWRLLHDTSSLFYIVFKAKFFPNTSVMEAKVPTNASYAWKSLMKGRDVIKCGVRWRIGLGRSVYI